MNRLFYLPVALSLVWTAAQGCASSPATGPFSASSTGAAGSSGGAGSENTSSTASVGSGGAGGTGGGTTVTGSSTGATSSSSSSSSSSGGGNPACGPGNGLIYMANIDSVLWSFNPATLVFDQIGTIGCTTSPGYGPWALALDRHATFDIAYVDGLIRAVDGNKLWSCPATPYAHQPGDFWHYSMTYSADAPGSSAETLFLSSWQGGNLAKVDTTTWTQTPVGSYDPVHKSWAMLAGTPDARLFGLLFPNQVGGQTVFAEIDKGDAHLVNPVTITGRPWAGDYNGSAGLVAWGGDFYLFYTDEAQYGVDKYSPADSTFVPLNVNMPTNLAFVVTASTCAP